VSHTIHKLVNRFVIFFFSLISATVNCIRKLFLSEHFRRDFAVFSIISHLDKIFDVRVSNCHLFVVNNSGEVVLHVVTIVARFPSLIERIPCSVVINKGGNVQHLTHPIVCHIYIGICVIDEGTHLGHNVIPLRLLFGRDERENRSGHALCFFDLEHSIARIGGNLNPPCATLPSGFLTLDFSTLTCKDNRLPNQHGRNILRGSYHRAD